MGYYLLQPVVFFLMYLNYLFIGNGACSVGMHVFGWSGFILSIVTHRIGKIFKLRDQFAGIDDGDCIRKTALMIQAVIMLFFELSCKFPENYTFIAILAFFCYIQFQFGLLIILFQ